MRLPFELTGYRSLNGRADPGKRYTIVEGLVTLPDARRVFMEGFLNDTHHFTPGPHAIELQMDVDRNRRLAIFVKAVTPIAAGQPRVAA